MSAEAPPGGIETIAIVNQDARTDGINRLRGDIAGFDRMIVSLQGEMAHCLRRICEIPEAIACIEGWKNRFTQQLETLEGNEIGNGHLNLHD